MGCFVFSLDVCGATPAPRVSLSVTSIAFGNQNIGSQSAAKTAKLTNIGTAKLSIAGISVTGINAPSFAASNNCGASLAPGAGCTIGVSFDPLAAGSAQAAVTIRDNASDSPQSIALTGTGNPQAATPDISPSGGTDAVAATVSITDSTPGAAIYFTTNGSTPTAASRTYFAPFVVTSTETVKAIAIADEYAPSAVASVSFTIKANPDQRADALIAQMTEAEKLQLVHGNATAKSLTGPHGAVFWVPGIPRLGIPDQLGADGPVGVADHVGPATALPSSLASAASWDLNEAYRYGEVIGSELHAYGLNENLGGNLNLIGREPRDGRTFETEGEDPYLAGEIEAQHLLGTQDQFVIAGVKHYAFNDQETARTQANALIDERSAHESDLLAFEVALGDSNAQMAMCAYNLVNGADSCQNDHFLNDVLKQNWGFRGFVLSDAYATESSVTAAMAGLDQEQPEGGYFDGVLTPESLADALANGDMPMSRLNDMVHRILRGTFAAGVFDHPAPVVPIDAAADAAIAQEEAEQGAVLLKNAGGQLPLSPSTTAAIAVIGSHADVGVLSGGGSAQVYPVGGAALTLPPACPPDSSLPGGHACTDSHQVFDPSSPLAAIKVIAPGAAVTYNDGANAAAAAKLAGASSVAIVFVSEWESEGMDRVSLNFPSDQEALANPHTIVVLENGGAHVMPWLGSVSAVLESWFPGQRGGSAIANLLFGRVNPSGKLPITFPASVESLPRPTIPIPSPPTSTAPFDVDYNIEGFNVGYKWYQSRNLKPLFAFGYGLSYTSFSISNLQLTPLSPGASGFSVSFNLKNTGSSAGAEVAQVYLGFPASTGEPPMRLVGWNKALLEPGEDKSITVVVDANSSSRPFSYWDTASNRWVVAPGDYAVFVGDSSDNVKQAGTFRVGP